MRNKAIQAGVVFDARKVAIVLDRHERIALERLQSESVARRSEGFSVKDRIVALKELLDDVEYRRLTGSRRAIEHHELLEPFGVAGYNGADGPLDFVTLHRRI